MTDRLTDADRVTEEELALDPLNWGPGLVRRAATELRARRAEDPDYRPDDTPPAAESAWMRDRLRVLALAERSEIGREGYGRFAYLLGHAAGFGERPMPDSSDAEAAWTRDAATVSVQSSFHAVYLLGHRAGVAATERLEEALAIASALRAALTLDGDQDGLDRDTDIEGSYQRAQLANNPERLRALSIRALRDYAVAARDERDKLRRSIRLGSG